MAKCSNCGNDTKNVVYFGDICLCNKCMAYAPMINSVKDKDIKKLMKLQKKKNNLINVMRNAGYKQDIITQFSNWLEGFETEETAIATLAKEEQLQEQRYQENIVNVNWPKIVTENKDFFKKKISPEGVLESRQFLFKDHAHLKSKLYDTFIECAKECHLPATISIKSFKAGGLLLGSTAEMLCIDGGYTPFIVVNVRTCGTYLYVSLHVLVEENMTNKFLTKHVTGSLSNLAYFGQDIISISSLQAFVMTTLSVLEESFSRLQFVEYKSGFLGIQ